MDVTEEEEAQEIGIEEDERRCKSRGALNDSLVDTKVLLTKRGARRE